MGKQVVTIGKDGSISGLQRKPGQGIDLRQFGKAQIERVSEIEFSEDTQRWHVHVLRGPWAGMVLCAPHFVQHLGALPAGGIVREGLPAVVEFDGYDEAVAAEIAFLDALRQAGTH